MFTELHRGSRIEPVDVNAVRVDLSYQRDPSRDLVDRIQGEWNILASGILLVSDRGERNGTKVEGGLFLVDGQHRTLSAKAKGITHLDARIIDLTDEKDPGKIEALLRLHTNVGLSDRALERFKAQVRAGNKESIQIQKLLARFDTEINMVANAEFGINCVSTIESLYRYDDGHLLADALDLMKSVYGEIRGQTAQSNLFKAYAWFIEAHSEQSDRDRVITQVQMLTTAQLGARARTHASVMGKALWFNYYRAIVEQYNEKLHGKGRLEWISRGANRLAQSSGQSFY